MPPSPPLVTPPPTPIYFLHLKNPQAPPEGLWFNVLSDKYGVEDDRVRGEEGRRLIGGRICVTLEMVLVDKSILVVDMYRRGWGVEGEELRSLMPKIVGSGIMILIRVFIC
ncbi:hypothetical protein TSUD_214520 [Trifolium subterraneum]|uniref:Uncharacterized protein n=1 Tax=Trifolium subterraneum TaxID=3900 RepID=A0A2Z6NJZ0_TRISU|nr:hypothetical protein TSUD_214520 [Trifolium subterraneum]